MKVALLSNASGRPHETYSVITDALAAETAKAGEDAILVGLKRGASSPFRARRAGFPDYHVGAAGAWYHLPLAAAQLAWIFRREKIDVVHLHFSGPDFLGVGPLLFFLRRLPVVLTFHSFDERRLRDCGRLYPPLLDFLLRRAERVTAVSRSVAERLEAYAPAARGRVLLVANGVDRDDAPAAAAPSGADPYVFYAGPLCHEKGVDLLLLAFGDLVARDPRPLRLVLCGEDLTGGRFADLIARLGLASRVDCRGPRPHDEVLRLMRGCFFYVCASREESFGIAILEAMARGRPVVAPEIGGVPDYARSGVDALLFRAGDLASLTAAMRRVAAEPALRRLLEANAPAAAARYSWERTRAAYAEIYASAAGATRGAGAAPSSAAR